jgi:hypothetical protein
MTTVQFDSNADKVFALLAGASMNGLVQGAEHVLTVSNARVPHEEGPLELSGAVSQDDDLGEVAISYDTPYAAEQHENLTYRHDEGREAKYLENAANEERATVLAIVAARTRRETRS